MKVFGTPTALRALLFWLLVITAGPGRAEPPETPFSEVFAQLAARLVGVVVNISTTQAAAPRPRVGRKRNAIAGSAA